MRDNEPDHLDALIDDTARAMTAGMPAASLRVAVRQRIDARTRKRPVWQVGAAAATMAAAALLIIVVGRTVSGPPAREQVATLAGGLPAGESVVALATPLADALTPSSASDVRRAARVTPLSPAQPVVVQAIALEPLADVRPVELELMEVPMPLRAEWVEIERLVFE